MQGYVKGMSSSYYGHHLSGDFIDIMVKPNNFTASQYVRCRGITNSYKFYAFWKSAVCAESFVCKIENDGYRFTQRINCAITIA